MKVLVQISLLCVSFLFLTSWPCRAQAQILFPVNDGEKIKYNASIEMPKGYVSGICVLINEGTIIKGSIFNEFGITALSFSYDLKKGKIKLYSVVKMMDKWYIKKILKKDLSQMMKCLQKGESVYQNEKYHITYSFSNLNIKEEKESCYDTEE